WKRAIVPFSLQSAKSAQKLPPPKQVSLQPTNSCLTLQRVVASSPAPQVLSPVRHQPAFSPAICALQNTRPDEDTLNRIVWHAMKGVAVPYPAEWAGAHGRDLQKLGLRLDPNGRDDDNDDND